MAKKNILNVTFLANRSGAEVAFLNYARALKDLQFNVYNLIKPSAKIRGDLERMNVQLLLAKKNTNVAYDLFSILFYRKILKSLAIDIVVVHDEKAANLFGKIISKEMRLISVSNLFMNEINARSDYVVSLTRKRIKQLKMFGFKAKQLSYMPNCNHLVATPEYNKKSLSKKIRLGFYARLCEQKAPEILLEVAKLLKDKNIDFTLILGGAGEDEILLKKTILAYGLGNYVEMVGWVSNIKEFFKNIDIFLFSSRFEYSPFTLIEAFAYSTPIIATKVEGSEDMIANNETGCLVKADDPKAMVRKIISLSKNPEQYQKIAKNAYHEYSTKYSYDSFKQSLNNVIASFQQV